MNRIKNVLETLKKTEIHLIGHYIRCISRSNKKLLLLNLVTNQNLKDVNQASILLYDNKHSINIKKLEERLLSDIEDVILLRYSKRETDNLYEKNKSDVISFLLLANYYIHNNLLSEAYLKLHKVKKILGKQDLPLLEVIYQQLWCNYLECLEDEKLENELEKLSGSITEYNYLNQLKIQREKRIFQETENKLVMSDNTSGHHFYTICSRKLTRIEKLIDNNEINEAENESRSLLTNLTANCKLIPVELIIDVWMQIVKINLLHKKYISNKPIFARIKTISFNSAMLKNKYLFLNFLNHFKLGEYELCSHIIKYVDADLKIRDTPSNTKSIQWEYFDICLYFMRKEYHKVLKSITLLATREITTYVLYINIKIVELYTLALLNHGEDALCPRIVVLKREIKKPGAYKTDKYSNLVYRIEKVCSNGKNVMKGIPDDYSSDVLNFELIPFEYFEDEYIKLRHKYQVAI